MENIEEVAQCLLSTTTYCSTSLKFYVLLYLGKNCSTVYNLHKIIPNSVYSAYT